MCRIHSLNGTCDEIGHFEGLFLLLVEYQCCCGQDGHAVEVKVRREGANTDRPAQGNRECQCTELVVLV